VSDTDKRRDAIEQTAREWRETVTRSGGQVTHEQARQRVTDAVTRGDRKRDNDNR
jgi:hypothetical protein